MRRTAGYTCTDYKTNTQITKELKIMPILDKLLEYKRNWIQYVYRMPRNRLPRVMKHYSPTGRRNYDRHLKRLLDEWDRNGSTSGPTPWQIYDYDDDDDEVSHFCVCRAKGFHSSVFGMLIGEIGSSLIGVAVMKEFKLGIIAGSSQSVTLSCFLLPFC